MFGDEQGYHGQGIGQKRPRDGRRGAELIVHPIAVSSD